MKKEYKKALEEEVKTALLALGNLGNLTLMIKGNKMKNGILEVNKCEEMDVDLGYP